MERGEKKNSSWNSMGSTPRSSFYGKRGQVTIFIIVGILIVVAITLVFFFQNELGISTRLNTNPTKIIQTCAQKAIEPMIESIFASGGVYYSGSNNNQFLTINGSRSAILCETNVIGASCISTHPIITEEIRKVVKQTLTSKISSCFTQLNKNYPNVEISGGILDFDIEIVKDMILVKIRKPLTVSSGEESNSFNNFDFSFNSKIYNFAELANVIVNTESSCDCTLKAFSASNPDDNNPFLTKDPITGDCDADLTKLNNNYPNYLFRRINLINEEKVYTIESLDSSAKNFRFVVKNCLSKKSGGSTV